MDFDDEPQKKEEKKPEGGDIFDLLGESEQETKPQNNQNTQQFTYDQLLGTTQLQDVPNPSGYGITLNSNDFRTDAVNYF